MTEHIASHSPLTETHHPDRHAEAHVETSESAHPHHHGAEHEHHPPHTPENSPVISQRWKWLTVLGNAAIGLSELATGNLSTLAVTSDGLHNAGDAATYYMQAENILNPNLAQKRKQRLRKIAHWVITATSLGMGAKAGVDLALNEEGVPHAASIYTAGASLALNGLMFARLRKGIKRKKAADKGVYEHDLSKHFLAVDIPSAGLAVAGAGLQRYNVDIEQVAAIVSGAVGAYAFWPSEKNLNHNCLDHDHEHGHGHGHGHEKATSTPKPYRERKKTWRNQITYKARHGVEKQSFRSRWQGKLGLGAAALALVGSLGSDTPLPELAKQETIPATASASIPNLSYELPHLKRSTPLTRCEVIAPGDTQWGLVEKQLDSQTDSPVSPSTITTVTRWVTAINPATNPYALKVGECLPLPAPDTLHILTTALEQPEVSDPQLVASLRNIDISTSSGDSAFQDSMARLKALSALDY